MMLFKTLSAETIDIIAPEHSRTSCSDADPCNGGFEIEEIKAQGLVVERIFKHSPRCARCFLLTTEGYLPKHIKVAVDVRFVLTQPKITSEG